jgi:uncharacterized protein
MPPEILEKFIYEYLKDTKNIARFIWHGGEPLLAGKPFFNTVIQLQKKYNQNNCTIENSIQTNGTLLDNYWIKFFSENNFKVGVSIDGDKSSHDFNRKNAKGKGTHDLIVRNIKKMRKANLTFGTILTVTKDTIEDFKNNFIFLVRELRINNFSINLYDTSYYEFKDKSSALSNEDVWLLYKECIDLWLEENNANLKIREIENLAEAVKKIKPSCCYFNGNCSKFYCLNYDGTIFPCNRLSNQNNIRGDISKQELNKILSVETINNFRKSVNLLPEECMKCEWQQGCNNGCTSMRDPTTNKYIYCEARKLSINYLKKIIEN